MAPGTMQAVKFAAALLCAIASRSSAIDVSSCEEFAVVDRKTETEVTITNADFTCTNYTRLSIRSPSMVLKSAVGAVTFSNLAFSIYGALIVEPDVEFTGIELVVCRERTSGIMTIIAAKIIVMGGICPHEVGTAAVTRVCQSAVYNVPVPVWNNNSMGPEAVCVGYLHQSS